MSYNCPYNTTLNITCRIDNLRDSCIISNKIIIRNTTSMKQRNSSRRMKNKQKYAVNQRAFFTFFIKCVYKLEFM